MTFADKLERLIEESGWSRATVSAKIGRAGQPALARWLGKASKVKPDGSPARNRPNPADLIALSDLFHVDIRWLIDDSLGWEERRSGDSAVLMRIRRLSPVDQLEMWEWHIQRKSTVQGPGSIGGTEEKREGKAGRNGTPKPDRGEGSGNGSKQA